MTIRYNLPPYSCAKPAGHPAIGSLVFLVSQVSSGLVLGGQGQEKIIIISKYFHGVKPLASWISTKPQPKAKVSFCGKQLAQATSASPSPGISASYPNLCNVQVKSASKAAIFLTASLTHRVKRGERMFKSKYI